MINEKMTRRGLLGGLFTSALVLSTPGVAKALCRPETDEERFYRLARTGKVENQNFIFTKGVFLDSSHSDLKIINCKFTIPPHADMSINVITFSGAVNNVHIVKNTFNDHRVHGEHAIISVRK